LGPISEKNAIKKENVQECNVMSKQEGSGSGTNIPGTRKKLTSSKKRETEEEKKENTERASPIGILYVSMSQLNKGN
jgi:hypothetical protein